MNILLFLIIGLLAGWIAATLMRGRGFGLLGNLILGVIGAFIGGFLLRIFGIVYVNFLGELVAAVIGAMVLLGIAGKFRRRSE